MDIKMFYPSIRLQPVLPGSGVIFGCIFVHQSLVTVQSVMQPVKLYRWDLWDEKCFNCYRREQRLGEDGGQQSRGPSVCVCVCATRTA